MTTGDGALPALKRSVQEEDCGTVTEIGFCSGIGRGAEAATG